MKTMNIGNLRLPVSKLILGVTWADSSKQEHFEEIANAYVEAGGTLLDIGRFYGVNCEAEVCVREWLKHSGLRDKVMISDKACHPFVRRNGYFDDNSRWRVSPEMITEDLEYSLDRMDLDYFDLYFLHRDDVNVPVGDLMDRLEAHRLEGRIRAYGVSNWRIPRIREAMDYCKTHGYQGITVSSPSYGLATVTQSRWKECIYIGDNEAKEYHEMGMPVFSWSAQGAGFFAQQPNRLALPDLYKAYCTDTNFEKLRRATRIAEEKGVSATNIALAYVLNQVFVGEE